MYEEDTKVLRKALESFSSGEFVKQYKLIDKCRELSDGGFNMSTLSRYFENVLIFDGNELHGKVLNNRLTYLVSEGRYDEGKQMIDIIEQFNNQKKQQYFYVENSCDNTPVTYGDFLDKLCKFGS